MEKPDEARIQDAAHKLAALQREHALFGFRPNEPQMTFIRNQRTKLLAMMGANRSGKSTIVSIEGICRAMGFRPFLSKDDPDYRVTKPNGELLPVPNVGQVAAQDYPNGVHRIQWPAWQKWLPKDCYKIEKSEKKVIRELWIDVSECPWADKTHPNYPWSQVHFFAYEQGREPFAGFACDWILNDEPPPRDIWIEQMRGLVASGGGWMGAMTVVDLKQAWIYDVFSESPSNSPWESKSGEDMDRDKTRELVGSLTRLAIPARMEDNFTLTQRDIDDYSAMLTAEERAVRIEGLKVHMLGTEWGKYWDENSHVLAEHRDPDPELPHIMATDPHPTVPYATLWVEVNEDDELYVWAESFDWRLDTIHAIAQEIKRTEKWKSMPKKRGFQVAPEPEYLPRSSGCEPSIRLMDPFGKSPERGVGKDIFQQMGEEGLYYIPWQRGGKDGRVRKVREFLKKGYGPEGKPRLTVSPRCKELIFEIPRYREKLPDNPELQERTGKMMKVRDHLVDCLIAICNADYPYRALSQMKGRSVSEGGSLRDRMLGKRRREMVSPSGGW